MSAPVAALEPGDARLASSCPPALRPWNDLAVLLSADVHMASRLSALAGDDDPLVALGVAFTVRAVRHGHVCVDLARVAATATSDVDPAADLTALPWPEPGEWAARLAGSRLVTSGDAEVAGDARPIRLVDGLVYLDRYWRQERQVAADLAGRAGEAIPGIDEELLRVGLERLFPAAGDLPSVPDLARLAAAAAVTQRLAVVAGGPGTGKTTAVARILALVDEQAEAAGVRSPRVALAAPTGKAAARLAEAVHGEAVGMQTGPEIRGRLLGLGASTLHRLLGSRPDSRSRFRHDRANRLPHDVVVVDETSMLSLSLMAKLLDAVRPEARVVLVGDPRQLASVDAGAVLGDLVGPAASHMRMTGATRARLGRLTGGEVAATDPPGGRAIGDGIVVLRKVHRFGGRIADLASAVAAGDADAAVAVLRDGAGEVRWVEGDGTATRSEVTAAGLKVAEAAAGGRGGEALDALGSLRVLCAYRHGPAGVGAWNGRIQAWVAAALPELSTAGAWFPGRPLLVTRNDYEVQLYNGDTGVVLPGPDGRPVAAFERRGALREVSPSRLEGVETVYAMTIHKAQGSQFGHVVVILPEADGPLLTRELLYTAVTRARTRVSLVASEEVLRAAVQRPVARASGLRERLWGR